MLEHVTFNGIYFLIWLSTGNAYYMNDDMYCNSKLSMVSEKVFQLKLTLNDDNIYASRRHAYHGGGSCELKIEAWYNTYNKLMFYFEHLNLDCSEGHLEFFVVKNKDTWVKGLEHDVCGPNKPEGVFTGDTRFLKIKYVPRKSQQIMDVFSIIVTAFRDDTCPRYAYECKNSRCIDKDLACNGYDSCGDGYGCNLSSGEIAGIVIGSLVVGAFLITIVAYCMCRRKCGTFCNRRQENQISEVSLEDCPTRDQVSYSFPDDTVICNHAPSTPSSNAVTSAERHIGAHHGDTNQFQEDSNDFGPPPSYTDLFGNNPIGIRQANGALNESSLTNIQSSINSEAEQQPVYLANDQDEQNENITQPPSYTEISRNTTSMINEQESRTRTVLESPV